METFRKECVNEGQRGRGWRTAEAEEASGWSVGGSSSSNGGEGGGEEGGTEEGASSVSKATS